MTAPNSPPPRPRGFDLAATSGPAGIGGWLLFFVIVQSMGVVLNLIGLKGVPENFSPEAWALGDRVPQYRAYVIFESVGHVLLLLGGTIGLLVIFRRHPLTPTYYVWFLAFAAVYSLIQGVGASVLYPQFARIVTEAGGNAHEVLNEQQDLTYAGYRGAALSLVWLLYWRASDRVANTFALAEAEDVTSGGA